MKYSVKVYRTMKEMTQEQAAEKVGVTTATWNAWEQSFGKVKLKNADKVAKVLGVKLDDIFFE